jgi:hypothetical protein
MGSFERGNVCTHISYIAGDRGRRYCDRATPDKNTTALQKSSKT